MLRLACRPAQHACRRSTTRGLHDLAVVAPDKPVVAHGPPGYSAVTGHTATVFGCTGFLGRYLVAKLARMGTQVVVPFRDEDDKRHLKPMGDLGQIVPMEWDLRNETQIAECVRHSDIVYNLVGRDYETKNFNYHAVHVAGAERIASVVAQCGVARLVHVSHLNAARGSPSVFYHTKALGEERVRAAFPGATIVRPAAMWGHEDKFLHNIAIWPIWWKLNHAKTRVRPVHVLDVAQALQNLLHIPRLERTLHLPGPSVLTYAYLLEMVASLTCRPASRAPTLPRAVAVAVARVGQRAVWWPTVSPDEVRRRYLDDEMGVAGDWDVVGVRPGEIEESAIRYLRIHRSAEDFVRPVVFPPREAPMVE